MIVHGSCQNTGNCYLSNKIILKKSGTSLPDLKIPSYEKILSTLVALCFPFFCLQRSPFTNSGDSAWMLVATTLVILMTPAGLALFYGGLLRSKNVLNTIEELCCFLYWIHYMDYCRL